MEAIKRFILWDYPRASWQYDVMVALILGFIFLTPREVFRDQPRESQIHIMEPVAGGRVFFFEPRLLADVRETDRINKASELLKGRFGKKHNVTRVEAIYDSEEELTGYRIVTQP